jgi:hypothetical protein
MREPNPERKNNCQPLALALARHYQHVLVGPATWLYGKHMGVFDGVALEVGCTPGSSICCLVSFFCSSARPAGAKKGLSARLYSYAIFHRIAGARLRWARGKWLGVILYH